MRMPTDEVLLRFRTARVARLATAAADGTPHLVPITFAVTGDGVAFAVDHKPKSGKRLRRLRNIAENPRVTVLVDHYREDWTALWWARADGTAAVLDPGDARAEPALDGLVAKYPQYRDRCPTGSVVTVAVTRWSGWRAS
jgi:PPOX class probable F420-dependent enzyme